MGKRREPETVLKTDERNLVLELGGEGKFVVKLSGCDENRAYARVDKLEVRSRTAAR